MGIDKWRPYEMRLLTREGLQELVNLRKAVEREGIWPLGILDNIVVLMGSPKGDSKPIALMPMLYRIWCKAKRG